MVADMTSASGSYIQRLVRIEEAWDEADRGQVASRGLQRRRGLPAPLSGGATGRDRSCLRAYYGRTGIPAAWEQLSDELLVLQRTIRGGGALRVLRDRDDACSEAKGRCESCSPREMPLSRGEPAGEWSCVLTVCQIVIRSAGFVTR